MKKIKINKKMEKLMIYLIIVMIKIFLKISLTILKRSFQEIFVIKKIKKQKIQVILLILLISISFILLLKHYNFLVALFLSFVNYFILRGSLLTLYDFLKSYKNKVKIKILFHKHRKLFERFKIKVVNESKDKITIFSDELVQEDLIKQKSKLESYFNRKISCISRQHKNFRFIDIVFHRATAFKRIYKFQDWIEKIPEKKIGKMFLPVVVGLSENEEFLIKDLTDIKHLFISGESGGGKSTILNCILQSLMMLTNNVVYILVDLKGGVEMSDYDNFKNCYTISDSKYLRESVETIHKIMKERLNCIRKTKKCKNIQSYNQKGKEQMPYIIFVLDELAEIKLNSDKETKEVENLILQILQQGRAAGIHVVGATQRASGNQVSTDLRAGFLYFISFAIKRLETQKMAGVVGTQDLKTGEFKTSDSIDKIYKGFLIAEESNEKKNIKQCNKVFEKLEEILTNNNIKKEEIIEIDIEKKVNKSKNKYKHYFNIILSKLNIRRDIYNKKEQDRTCFLKNVKPVSKEVIEIVSMFDTNKKSIEKNAENDIINNSVLLKSFVEFCRNNSSDGLHLPNRKFIEKSLNISERKRKELSKQALKEKYFTKYKSNDYRLEEV